MSPSKTSRSRRGTLAAAAATVALAVLGVVALVAGLHSSSGPPQPPVPAAAAPSTPIRTPAAHTGSAGLHLKTLTRSRPVTLTIPSLGVSSHTIVDLGKNPDGSLQVPTDFGQPGWFTDGPAPGQFGPAVIAGHVDSKNGPGIFYRLGALRPGAAVTVTRADGTAARFTVDKVERYPKDRFPTIAVYGDTTHRAELRLITCGGLFDRRTGHYVDNVVAYAHLS